jgi:hypothetical protein
MTYAEVEEILTESNKDNWLRFPDVGIYTFKSNLDLVIKLDKDTIEEPIKLSGYEFLNKDQYPCWYNVYYKTSLVARVKMLKVDDGSAIIPYMVKDNNKVSKLDANIARIIDEKYETNLFIELAGLEIV